MRQYVTGQAPVHGVGGKVVGYEMPVAGVWHQGSVAPPSR
jgi:hypothetical protein